MADVREPILYVEDEPAWVEEVRAALPQFEIVHAATPAEAHALFGSRDFRLAFVDLGLAGGPDAGLEVVRELRARRPDLGIVVLTSRSESPYVRDSLRSGADDYIEKKDLQTALLPATRRLLRRQPTSRGAHLTAITLAGFKCWRERHSLPLGRLNLILGANSSGKSALLHAALLLKQTAESSDRGLPLQVGGPHARLVDLGTFDDIVFGHERANATTLGLAWAEPARSSGLSFETTVALEGGSLRTVAFKYKRDGASYGMSADARGHVVLVPDAPQGLVTRTARPPIKCYGFPPDALAQVPAAVSDELRDLQFAFESMLERVHYLGPLRERPEREYTWTGEQPASVGVRGERAVEALLALSRSGSGAARMQALLSTLGLARSFRLHQLSARQFEVRLVVEGARVEVGLADVGFGISQVLPLLVAGLTVPEGSIILTEQPELHLHPAAQAALGDVLLELSRARNIQFIAETHSEHLLGRIQRRVAEAQVDARDTRLYFCRKGPEGTTAEPLQLDPYGEIANWPPGFFGDPLAESAARVRAGLQRRRDEGL